MAFNDGVKSAPIAYIGLVSVIVTLIVVMLLQVLFFGERDTMLAADQASQGPPAALADLTAKLTVLTRRELVDRDRGVVRIGISRAMELVVKELSEGKTPAGVAGPPLPAVSPAAPTAPAGGEPKAPVSGEKQIPTGAQPAAGGPANAPKPAAPSTAQEKK